MPLGKQLRRAVQLPVSASNFSWVLRVAAMADRSDKQAIQASINADQIVRGKRKDCLIEKTITL
jgi:hypothetical protein